MTNEKVYVPKSQEEKRYARARPTKLAKLHLVKKALITQVGRLNWQS